MPLILDRSAGHPAASGDGPLAIDFSGITPDRLAGLSEAEIARRHVLADERPCPLGDVCTVRGTTDDGRIECRGDFSRVHWLAAGMQWGEMVVAHSAGRHAGEGMTGGRLSIGGDAGDWLAAELGGGTVLVAGSAGDNTAAALPGSQHGLRGGMVLVEGHVGSLAGARMRRGILAVGGGCGPAAALELRAGTVLVIGEVGPQAGLGMRRGSLIAASTLPPVPPLFRRGALWRPTFLPLLAAGLRRAGFRAIGSLGDAFSRPWQQWHGDPLAGGRGEIFHRSGLVPAVS
jgi:formylmethanofuran dehydrogenase subunit C